MPTMTSGSAASGSQPHPRPTPSPAGSTPTTPTASGQAAFAGTWTGTVNEPGWTITNWAVRLVIPASGRQGSYSAPSLGCSGTFQVTGNPTTTMTGRAKTTGTVNTGCVKAAHVILSLAGSGKLSLTWMPAGKDQSPGSATLSRS